MGIWTLRRTQPLTNLTFWLNYQIGGRDPFSYHLIGLALHLGAVLLAYACLRKLLPERAALAAAAVFAIHPIQAEAVDYVWARGEALGAVLCFAALLAWLNGRRWIAVAWFRFMFTLLVSVLLFFLTRSVMFIASLRFRLRIAMFNLT